MIHTSGLYDSRYEHDACGVGFVVHVDGRLSHEIISSGIEVLDRLAHRGAAGANSAGDGAGLLIQIPDSFFRAVCPSSDITLPPAGDYGVGMFFLPPDPGLREICCRITEEETKIQELDFIGWREVPADSSALAVEARAGAPFVAQCFIGKRAQPQAAFERRLYILRRSIENAVNRRLGEQTGFYIPSLSRNTLVFKGMMMGGQIGRFYTDLADPELCSALVIVHQRYSTNTFPSWKLAQPFRYLGHNGEINTLSGNIKQMRAREKRLASEHFGRDLERLLPIIDERGSDSACLDNALELLVAGGRDLAHAMMMLIPQAWGTKYPMGPDLRGFFEYHSGLMEPWDGPAAIAFSDGRQVGALLDRNGLRPARYTITRDGLMVLASEAGVLDFSSEQIQEKGALRPGQMILVDLPRKRVIKDGEIKSYYARRQPYRRWVEENKISLRGLFGDVSPVRPDTEKLFFRHSLFGYSREDLQLILAPMAATGHEPIGSMGCDTPLAVLSERPQMLYNYFKQLFAQVTNPPIDPIREELVMSIMTFMGNPPNILSDVPQNSRLIKLRHPILSNEDLDRIRALNIAPFRATTLSLGFPASDGLEAMEEALRRLETAAVESVSGGRSLIILSDRNLPVHMAPIPAMLAVATVNQALVRKGLRTGASVLMETGEAREVHHMALLLGYGATAINPYLAFETVADMVERNVLDPVTDAARAIENYIEALCQGLLKIMSRMGISTLRSYRGAQVFEAVGLNPEVVARYFSGTVSRIGGIGLPEICSEVISRFDAAQDPVAAAARVLPSGGQYRFRKDGERHLWTPQTISLLQRATRENNVEFYRQYASLVNEQTREQSTLRGLFRFKEQTPVSLEEVEPESEIMKRFVTSAMSFGSISREAHETLAVAMNRIGAASNSGEGGEDPARYAPLPNGDRRASAIKQVASGRFGVTIHYLTQARELQIKISQGAKPGEGGQLPGHKVNAEIARVRHSTPGVTLISPPPHHDIYSIEDIKQLIFDLKNANPQARVSVKLVSEVGVGTVAAGVVKGHADMVLISGYDGGTGASPLSSIRHVGAPWELGLAETQQTLVRNNLRGSVRLQADGQMKTGRDIVMAALLGAEEFGFATAPLVVCGCVMMRKCHQNLCPVGVATQDPELRKCFTGKPEYVINFFRMLAGEVREHMARLGIRKMDELIGRTDLLEMNPAIHFWKTRGLDFSKIFHPADSPAGAPVRYVKPHENELEDVLDRKLIRQAAAALESGKKVELLASIRNTDRTVGTMLSGEVTRRYGEKGLPDDTIVCRFTGSAGQSFGAFCAKGITLELHGESNDYLGKGLSGGKIIVRPPDGVLYEPSENIICGNVLLYGATSGEVYIGGQAGERFAIRNSGARAVVEGVGDHGCEYMTAGRVVILGATGVNFGAGMSGGIAYIYDADRRFDSRCNLDMVDLEWVKDPRDIAELRDMIEKHCFYTGSRMAAGILERWESSLASFIKVFPMEYRKALGLMMREDAATERMAPTDG